MISGGESRSCEEQRQNNRVSSAVWPAKTRRGVPTNKAAQQRRDWIIQHPWWLLLVNVLSWRTFLSITTLLVVVGSLVVALLGLSFWYLLLLPLMLFTSLLLLPLILNYLVPKEEPVPFLSVSTQKLESSMGFFSQRMQERNDTALFSNEGPTTPMPADLPLIRVLETYDLRETPVEHFLLEVPGSEIGERGATDRIAASFWTYTGRAPLDAHGVPYSQMGFVAHPSEGEASPSLSLSTESPAKEHEI